MNHGLYVTVSLNILTDNAHSFMATVYHLLMATSSSKVKVSNWFHERDSEFSELQSSEMNPVEPLGCGRAGDWQHEYGADKSGKIM